MINITKEKGYVVITSDDEKTFLIGEGILSVPCNTIEYTLDDESDFIQFNSIYEDGILFVGTIGNIQVNGTLVTRENIIEQLDSVFNESYEGGSASEVDLSNYYTKDELKYNLTSTYNSYDGYDQIITNDGSALNVAHINGQSILGQKQSITIEGESSGSGVESIDVGGVYLNGKLSISSSIESSDNSWRVGLNGAMYDSTTDEYYGEGDSMIFGVKSSDNSILVSDGGSLADLVINPKFIGMNLDNSTDSLSVGSGNTGNYYGSILLGRNISNSYNASILIGNGINNTVGNKTVTINIGNTLMGDGNGYVYIWKGSNIIRLQDYIVNEWTGTQSEYDALGTYDSGCTYNIIEG